MIWLAGYASVRKQPCESDRAVRLKLRKKLEEKCKQVKVHMLCKLRGITLFLIVSVSGKLAFHFATLEHHKISNDGDGGSRGHDGGGHGDSGHNGRDDDDDRNDRDDGDMDRNIRTVRKGICKNLHRFR